jgi:lipid II isoglutaminyl synthase (glutamine-hydrolysing)
MSAALTAKLAAARAVGALSRLRGGGATSAPGKALLRLEPDAIALLGSRLRRGSAVISATNGKTTTAAMAAAILSGEGVRLVHNRAGANMAGGIASTLLDAADARGAIAGELGLFEVDELWLDRVVAELHPRAILLGNLFRDQLDRYGELDTIAERWGAVVASGAQAQARLVLNADDPVLADLGRDLGERVVYFGVEDDSLALPGLSHAADAKHCRNCGAPYVFDAVYLGHLGRYHCASCGRARPSVAELAVWASDVRLEGVRAARFVLHASDGSAEVALALPGLYNVYNALGAAALASALGVELPAIVAGLQGTRAAFGRAESVTLAGPSPRELRILLVKNPAGANEVLRTLALEPGEHDVLGVLNDRIADGRDVSWIWDADFELLAERIRRVTCAGTRAAELAVRLKYAGVDPARIRVEPDLAAALAAANADRPARTSAGQSAASGRNHPPATAPADGDDNDDIQSGGSPPLYALPTYTAMLALRELLAREHRAGSPRPARRTRSALP